MFLTVFLFSLYYSVQLYYHKTNNKIPSSLQQFSKAFAINHFSIVINTNVTFTVNDPAMHPAVCAKYRQLLPPQKFDFLISLRTSAALSNITDVYPLLPNYLVVVFSVYLCRVLPVTLWRGLHVEKSKTVDRSDREVYRERFARGKSSLVTVIRRQHLETSHLRKKR